MAREHAAARYRKLYTKLLRLYPLPFRVRFGESMAQTFNDLCRECQEAGHGLFAFVMWTFVETFAGIVRERKTMILTREKSIIRIAAITALILLLPLLAMQFTDQVSWDLVDFAVAGTLLFGAGLAYELVARRADTNVYRAAFGLAVATALLLVWMNLAVGLIGSEDNPANLMYVGVVAIGFVGAVIARFRPQGMARALFATALAQALVPVIALLIRKPQASSAEAASGMALVIGVNALFVILFVASGLLFRRAGAADPQGDKQDGAG